VFCIYTKEGVEFSIVIQNPASLLKCKSKLLFTYII